ncbi:MAG: hypothetical protein GXP45_02490 [bacterium]|nr:hypothetical protein [bacterium]
MLKSQETKDQTNKIQLALASVLFFAPFVQSLLKKRHFDLDQEDLNFVHGYSRLGYLIIGVLLLTISSAILMYVIKIGLFLWIYKISAILLVAMIIIGIFAIFANIKILQEGESGLHYQSIKTDKSDIFLSFLPLYNIYLRYKLHSFDHPYRWSKESILWWTLLVFVAIITKNGVATGFILSLIVIRLSSLMAGIDVIDDHIKYKLNKLFYKNPEELWGYVRGSLLFWYQKFTSKQTESLSFVIKTEKETMQKLFRIQNRKLVAQYIL